MRVLLDTSVIVRFQNNGNADGRIPSIDVAGAGFTLTEVPFVPLTLSPGNSITFTLNFNPTQPGRVNGIIRRPGTDDLSNIVFGGVDLTTLH